MSHIPGFKLRSGNRAVHLKYDFSVVRVLQQEEVGLAKNGREYFVDHYNNMFSIKVS